MRNSIQPQERHPQAREGFSIVEILVGMSLLSVVMMGLAGAATLGLSQMAKARQDLQYSADVQQVADSLVAKGWNNVAGGSQTIRGRSVSWNVTTLNPKSQKVTIVAQRRGLANTSVIYSDTVTLYLADVKVQ
jgi:prepilin-type N-terminal cleavage/methylation domain-containing protein